MRTNQHRGPGVWLGLILISAGGGLLSRELGLLPAHVRIADFWPLILVFMGTSSLLRARTFMGALFALTFLGLGGLLLARNLGFLAFPAAHLWPGLLVLLGVAFLIQAARASERRGPPEPPEPWPATDPPPPSDPWPSTEALVHPDPGSLDGSAERQPGRALGTEEDRLNRQITFAGLDCKIESQAWTGGELGVTAGGVEIDLRYARLAPEGALLDVRVVMGGVDIRVPDTWHVQCEVTPFLGGADDTTRSTQGSSRAPRLRVVGSVVLGGLSIRN